MVSVPKEIPMDYVNVPEGRSASKSGSAKGCAVNPAGRKVYMVVAASFGLLCVLQVSLNIYLHLAVCSSDRQIPTYEFSCNNLTKESCELKKKTFNQFTQQGWVYFNTSFYYISSEEKSWHDSRNYCLNQDADLVIINSKGEQDLFRKFHKFMWIGLANITGSWKWVDGSQLTVNYWAPGEPNRFEGQSENCAEARFFEMENSWNDVSCRNKNFWICEKILCV